VKQTISQSDNWLNYVMTDTNSKTKFKKQVGMVLHACNTSTEGRVAEALGC
jgi:hypothetical protein